MTYIFALPMVLVEGVTSLFAAIYILSEPVMVLTRKMRRKPLAATASPSTPGDTTSAVDNPDS